MRVVPEDILIGFLGRCLGLSSDLLSRLPREGTRPVPKEILDRYRELIAAIHAQKRSDSVLCDESWEWIWEVREGLNHLQLYGRLAWLNYNLFDLL